MKAGTGKSRTDRHRIPYKPIVFRFCRKNRKQESSREIRLGTGTKSGRRFSRPNSRIPYRSGKNPAGIPVFWGPHPPFWPNVKFSAQPSTTAPRPRPLPPNLMRAARPRLAAPKRPKPNHKPRVRALQIGRRPPPISLTLSLSASRVGASSS